MIVNDFGSIGVDAALLAEASDSGVVNLPNGCVCCTLGNDLYQSLQLLRDAEVPPEQIVIEASGVADPAATAAWGTSAGFCRGGVIVAAAADAVARQVRDPYIGTEVRRALNGADLVVVTKVDCCPAEVTNRARQAVLAHAPDAAIIVGSDEVDVDVAFNLRPAPPTLDVPSAEPSDDQADHLDQPLQRATATWAGNAMPSERLIRACSDMPQGIERVKGIVVTTDVGAVVVSVTSTAVSVEPAGIDHEPTGLVVIGQSKATVDAAVAVFADAAAEDV